MLNKDWEDREERRPVDRELVDMDRVDKDRSHTERVDRELLFDRGTAEKEKMTVDILALDMD